MNLTPLVFWAFFFLVGYLIAGVHCGLAFLAGALFVSLLAELFIK